MKEALLVLALALLVYAIAVYNGLVVLRNRFRNAFAQIDVQLKRRHDLIPSLVDSVKGYMAHERATLEAVTAARSRASLAAGAAGLRPGNAQAMLALAQAESALSGALGRLLATVEAFPQLKASANVLALQEELASTENRIAFARQHFNDSVLEYNNKRDRFPTNLMASVVRFPPAEMLEAIEAIEERRAPLVAAG